MPTTTNYGFYTPPLTGVTPDIPRDSKALADAVDTALKAEETARIAAVGMVGGIRTHAAATSLVTATWTDIPFDTMELDEVPWTGPASNFFTVPTAGYYQINAALAYAANATGFRGIRILVNGTVVRSFITAPGVAAGSYSVHISSGRKLSAGDTVKVQGHQTSGAGLALGGGASYNFVDITRVGR